jgi:hypothetical protein
MSVITVFSSTLLFQNVNTIHALRYLRLASLLTDGAHSPNPLERDATNRYLLIKNSGICFLYSPKFLLQLNIRYTRGLPYYNPFSALKQEKHRLLTELWHLSRNDYR